MADQERVDRLVRRLGYDGIGLLDIRGVVAYQLAHDIFADPQAHIDALVEAGVLRKSAAQEALNPLLPLYELVHEHKPVLFNIHSDGQVTRKCATCGEWLAAASVTMPARLPIEIPD